MNDNELHEMENQVTKGAKSADPMPKAPNYVPDAGAIEDLGGPTPTNSKSTDDSNKLKTPSAKFAQTGDPQTKGAAGATTLPGPAAIKSSGYGNGANEEVETDETDDVDVDALLASEAAVADAALEDDLDLDSPLIDDAEEPADEDLDDLLGDLDADGLSVGVEDEVAQRPHLSHQHLDHQVSRPDLHQQALLHHQSEENQDPGRLQELRQPQQLQRQAMHQHQHHQSHQFLLLR
jgi:hypothetical protein